ncbi:adenylate kinase family protein [Candidatus Micrarchaeota archaeon]|nr:adenylate kinase family protein [Candidatus Micrarchaeota archaeon]
MHIIITGTPATGKTTVAKHLGHLLNYEILNIKDFVNRKKLYVKNINPKEVDLKKLRRSLIPETKKQKNLIIEGHLACEIQLPAAYVIVLRCNPKELEKRMRKRGYKKSKIEENMLAELLDYCTQLSKQKYPNSKIFEIETSRMASLGIANKIKNIISGKQNSSKEISYTKELIRFLKRRNKWIQKRKE